MKALVKLILASGILGLTLPLLAQSTAFTYQGRLLDSGRPANGVYDLQFVLTDAPNNGNRVGPVLSNPAVPVTNGLFTIMLDFGNDVFDGSERWLMVGVRTNGVTAPYSRLLPSQSVAAIPYATFATAAATANTAGGLVDGGASLTSIPAASLVGTVEGNKLPPNLAAWAGISPETKQDTLGFAPATNSFEGLTNALGYQPATNGFLAGDGTGLVVASSNIVGTIPFTVLSGQIDLAMLPTPLPDWARITPAYKQDVLGYVPATNSYDGITNALGYQPATNGFLAGDGTALVVAGSNIVGSIPATVLSGQIDPQLLPGQLAEWAGNTPDAKQDTLGYVPATNSYEGITSALGFIPATNDMGFTNTGTIYIDPNGDDATAVLGRADRPWKTVTNGFAHITSGCTVVIRGTHYVDTVAGIGYWDGAPTRANLAISGVSNVTVYGSGSTLQFTGSGYGISIANVSNLKLRDLTLIGDTSLAPDAFLFGAIGFSGDNADVEISGCRIIHWLDHGITTTARGIYRTKNLKVTHNYFEDIGTTNLPAIGMRDGTCVSCFIGGNTWITENYATNVMRFVEYENAGEVYDGLGSDVWVLNNSVEACHDWGVLLVGYGYVLNNVRVIGNTFNHDFSGFVPGGRSISVSAGTNIVIADNIIYNNMSTAWMDKIAVTADSSNWIDSVTIERNKLYNCRVGFAINVSGGKWAARTVQHAEIRNNYMSNIDLGPQSGAIDTIFEGNVIVSFNPAQNGSAFSLLYGNDIFQGGGGRATHVVLRNNDVLQSLTENPSYVMVRGGGQVDYVGLFDNQNQAGIPPESLVLGSVKKLIIRHYDAGSPIDLVPASPGSMWVNTEGGGGTAWFIKQSGQDASGWLGLGSAVGLDLALAPNAQVARLALKSLSKPGSAPNTEEQAPPRVRKPSSPSAGPANTSHEEPQRQSAQCATTTVDMDQAYSTFEVNGAVRITDIQNTSPGLVKTAVLLLDNPSTNSYLLSLPAHWRTDNGQRAYDLLARTVTTLTVTTYGATMTNAVCRRSW